MANVIILSYKAYIVGNNVWKIKLNFFASFPLRFIQFPYFFLTSAIFAVQLAASDHFLTDVISALFNISISNVTFQKGSLELIREYFCKISCDFNFNPEVIKFIQVIFLLSNSRVRSGSY